MFKLTYDPERDFLYILVWTRFWEANIIAMNTKEQMQKKQLREEKHTTHNHTKK